MYRLTVKEHFDAAHSLRGYPGECADLHGHTWDVEAEVEGEELDEIEIVYDFKRLKDDLRSILSRFDHKHLNEVAPFDKLSPTGENLAREIYNELQSRVGDKVKVAHVKVWESPTACITYLET